MLPLILTLLLRVLVEAVRCVGELLRLVLEDDGLRLHKELTDGIGDGMVEMDGVRRTGGGGFWPWEPERRSVPEPPWGDNTPANKTRGLFILKVGVETEYST